MYHETCLLLLSTPLVKGEKNTKTRDAQMVQSVAVSTDTFLALFQINTEYTKNVGASEKDLACQCRDIRDVGLIPGSGKSPGE